MLSSGTEPLHIVELCREDFEIVGKRYETREYSLSGLIISDDTFKRVLELLDRSGCFHPQEGGKSGKVIMGAPLGDVHYICKNIVATMLGRYGYAVHNLGVDVSPQAFAEQGLERRRRPCGHIRPAHPGPRRYE